MTTHRFLLGTPVLLALALVLAAGCRRDAVPSAPAAPVQGTVRPRQDHFQLALDFLQRLDGIDPEKGMVQVAYHLNRWMEGSPPLAGWRADAMVAELPAKMREIPPLQTLDAAQFTTSDIRFLQEASWARSIAERVAEEPPPPNAEEWLRGLEASRGEPHAYEVGLAWRLFDWSVRNLQLDALRAYPGGEPGTAGAAPPAEAAWEAIGRAEPGPGYVTYPWQTLLFGRGDAWQRASVFLLLCRQQQVDAVMLALDSAESARQRPWLAAVLVDDSVYLFDTQLGLAIPGPGGQGVATLAQVREDRRLLEELSVGDELPYAMAAADLDRLVALVDAPPLSLTLRMKQLETEGSSSSATRLTVEPSRIAQRLREDAGIEQVRLWQTPLEVWLYRTALRQLASGNPELLRQVVIEDMIFGGTHPLVLGRIQQLRGNSETVDDQLGAKAYFLQARVPDAKLDQLVTSVEVQQELGIVRGRENDQQWQVRLQLQKAVLVGIKETASYWLGLIQAETGRDDAAVDWLEKRTLDQLESNPWRPGARYNLARVRIQQGQLAEARRLLLLDDSPQRHGNLLLARELRRQLDATPAPPAESGG